MSAPVMRFRARPLELAVWKNEKDGKVWYSCKLTRSYKDAETGQWKTTDSLNERDLPVAAALMSRAHMELGISKE